MTVSMEKSTLNYILAILLDKIVFLGPENYYFWTRIVRACRKIEIPNYTRQLIEDIWRLK